ncbi:MAG: amidohydrolase family protein [Chloroflexi bacterium]|nr:amidohydrolase family protein [Chloroflexota bacterium]MDA1147507.1 amidohydrolase family protein [Chloroflexota bacterium]
MVRAIDIHVHIPSPNPTSREAATSGAMNRYFGANAAEQRPMDVAQLADLYAELDMMAVLLTIDSETISGNPPVPMSYIADAVKQHPERFIGFGAVDPHKGKIAVNQLDEIAELGLKGLKFHAGSQHFFTNDPKFYPLWERASELGLICLFHSGTTGVGAGTPGGGGIKLEYMKPIPYIDDIAADFPDLKIILAHPPFPWDKEGLAMLRHKPNVYMDLSGWAPAYFDPLVVQYARTIAQDKILYGSDWPVLTPQRWLRDWEKYEFAPEVDIKIMRDNAAKLLGREDLITG